MSQGAQTAPVQEHRFACDQCGADFRFDPEQGQLLCDYCGNRCDVGVSVQELDFERALEAGLPAQEYEETRVSTCSNCSAQVVFDPGFHATECPFCATPIVADTGVTRQIKPKAVLPFGVDEATARRAVTAWLGQLWFAPNTLQAYVRAGRKMTGIYVPYWTFDAATASQYTGQRGVIQYRTVRTVSSSGKSRTTRLPETRWRGVTGSVARDFDDILVLASDALPKTYTDALEPWDLSALEPYRPGYLAGFQAEAYAIGLQTGFAQARAHMDRVILGDVKSDIGGDRQRVHRVDTETSAVTFKHVLLPVWLAAYKYRGKTYRLVVNGHSGEVQGERPWSVWKIISAVLCGLILAAGLVYGVGQVV